MKMVRLLAAGKSLMGLQQGMGRYRLSGGRLLPKFAAVKNPFRTSTIPEQSLTTSVERELFAQGGALPQTPDSESAIPANADPQRGVKKSSNSLRRLWNRWFPWSAARKQELRKAKLSIETVRVVRNDLSQHESEPRIRRPLVAVVRERRKQLQLSPRPAGVLPGLEVEPKAPFLTQRKD